MSGNHPTDLMALRDHFGQGRNRHQRPGRARPDGVGQNPPGVSELEILLGRGQGQDFPENQTFQAQFPLREAARFRLSVPRA